MKFKVDENLPVEIADLLKSANYDAVTVKDQLKNSYHVILLYSNQS